MSFFKEHIVGIFILGVLASLTATFVAGWLNLGSPRPISTPVHSSTQTSAKGSAVISPRETLVPSPPRAAAATPPASSSSGATAPVSPGPAGAVRTDAIRPAGPNAIFVTIEDDTTLGQNAASVLRADLTSAGYAIVNTRNDAALVAKIALLDSGEPQPDDTGPHIVWNSVAQLTLSVVRADDGHEIFNNNDSQSASAAGPDGARASALRKAIASAVVRFEKSQSR